MVAAGKKKNGSGTGRGRFGKRRTKPGRRNKGRSGAAACADASTHNGSVPWLTVVAARQHNLRNLDVPIPLGRLVCVTGVSGSGKSSLVNDIVGEALARDLNGAEKVDVGLHERIDGLEQLDKVITINQSPIGRTPRSNPATYIKVFDEIRALFARLPDAKVRGYKPGRFSFNVHTGPARRVRGNRDKAIGSSDIPGLSSAEPQEAALIPRSAPVAARAEARGSGLGGGRCEACEGNGQNRMEMDFLADVWVTCPVCRGHRFNHETLQILYKGKSIADVLEMDVQEALEHFDNVPKIARMLRTLHEVGLDYIKLGQSSTTLSGGEAQRIKLARELVKIATGRTLYLLDEPTTGLHFDDIKKLLAVLHRLVDLGNSVIVIEHNLDVVKTADWVIDLGPEGGAGGGRIVAAGTPEQVAASKRSFTGRALRDVLKPSRRSPAAGIKSAARRDGRAKRKDVITVLGAKQHNLKDITVEVPRNRTSVCCGPSGSGKSSFAIDTVYTEGQRRYVESLSSYARQFLGRLQPPKVDHVHGLSPAVCIEQKAAPRSPRSTVGTMTEIYDYLRVLWARIGQAHCPTCQVPIGTQTSDEIVEKILSLPEGSRVMLLAPIEPAGQESYQSLFQRQRANGYARVRIDGEVYPLDDSRDVDTTRMHRVELVVDRITIHHRHVGRITDSVEQSLAVGKGVLHAAVMADAAGVSASAMEQRFSQHYSCDRCGASYDELTPHHFSFNSRMGWCEACEGLGVQQGATPAAIVLHPTRSIADGAIAGWENLKPGSKLHALVAALADAIGFELHTPWNRLTETQRLAVLHGCGDEWIEVASEPGTGRKAAAISTTGAFQHMRFRWRGFFPAIGRATRSSWQYRGKLEELVSEVACDACAGGRLRPEPAAVRVGDSTIHEVCLRPLGRALEWFDALALSPRDRKIAGELLHEIRSRLRFLVDVGLDYLSLHRTASTLSGGESQRIQLASQIGTGLTGVLYVLDEPTIGLHPRDNARLIQALRRLRDLGNTLLLVEHDREIIESSDHVLDFGPGAGDFGGRITAEGSPRKLRSKRASLTGSYLAGRKAIPVPTNRRPVGARAARLTVHGARENNLQEIDVAFPFGRFTCVTGVSGSGKSTLVTDILHHALAARIHRARLVPGGHDRITGIEAIDKVINVDQSPIGNSPSSNPATYTGVFDAIRELFARLPLSRVRGYTPGRFSFNRPGGRCEACEGMGQRCIEMHFLPDVWVECESCNGSRFVPETLEIQFHDRSICDVLNLRVSAALELFDNVPAIRRMLQTLDDVGLGYLQLGQAAPTLSGGEAQRVKLAAELGKPSTGKTLYILDEPTTGLHFDDLSKLLAVLHRLVDLGNTCICIEHNLDVIKTADWIIDLGPEAGEAGGQIVVEGPPETVAADAASHTGRALAPVMAAGPRAERQVHKTELRPAVDSEPTPIDVGDGGDLPWQKDGRRWHMVDHVDARGNSVEWDPWLLAWLVDEIEAVGSFAPTDWNHRTRIEIKAPNVKPWFCHILTGSTELLDVAIRVPERRLPFDSIRAKLGVKTLDERKDLPLYGQWDRCRRRALTDGWEEWRLYLRDWNDIRRPAFRHMLKQAIAAYQDRVEREVGDPALAEPWTVDARRWHLSQRSISPRHVIRWKPALLMALLGRFRAMQPDLELSWNARTSVQMFTAGGECVLGKIVTNMGRGLRVELRAPRRQLTPAMIDRLGEDVVIKPGADYDRLVYWLRSLAQNDAGQLRAVWRMCRATSDVQEVQSA